MSEILKYGYLDFSVIKEGWSEYKLENGSIVRVRHILHKVIKEESGLSVNATTTISVFSPPELRGLPSPKAFVLQELESSIAEENLKFGIYSGF